MGPWRLILDGKRSASFNMAADAHLLDLAEAGDAGPAVRLYGWDRPSITIGHHQKLERAVDVARLGDTPVVRRITGGRALLHDDTEITYAVAGNFVKYPALGTTLHESYRVIADAIVRFYAGCGMGAYISRREDPLARSGLPEVQKGCFVGVPIRNNGRWPEDRGRIATPHPSGIYAARGDTHCDRKVASGDCRCGSGSRNHACPMRTKRFGTAPGGIIFELAGRAGDRNLLLR
jgi:hypothetical protein